MGLIKAAQAATGTVMADQWKEFFYCDSLDNDTLLVRGNKRTGSRSSIQRAMIYHFQWFWNRSGRWSVYADR